MFINLRATDEEEKAPKVVSIKTHLNIPIFAESTDIQYVYLKSNEKHKNSFIDIKIALPGEKPQNQANPTGFLFKLFASWYLRHPGSGALFAV